MYLVSINVTPTYVRSLAYDLQSAMHIAQRAMSTGVWALEFVWVNTVNEQLEETQV